VPVDTATLEVKPMWVPYTRANTIFRSYALAEDSSGIRMPGVDITWYEVKEDDSVEYKGMATTDADGVAYLDFFLEGTLSGSHIFVKAEDVISSSIWIQTPGAFMEIYTGVFQLDTDNIWDSQQAKTAMGFNCFASQPSGLYGEIWASNTDAETEIDDFAIWNAPEKHGDWEAAHPELERPPVTSEDAVNETSGFWNAMDYYNGHGFLPVPSGIVPPSGVPTPSGIVNTMKDMRVSVDGYWGQYLVSGYEIRTTYFAAAGIKNAGDDYYINRTDLFDGYSVFGDLGSWNDIVSEGAVLPFGGGTYDSTMYVLYTPEEYYSLEFDPAIDFYFRGVAIYSIDSDNILEYNEQDRTVEDVSSYAYLE